MTDAAPPQGWYDDPGDATRVRWWDGVQWTEHVRPREGAVDAPAAVAATTEPATEPAVAVPGAVDSGQVGDGGLPAARWYDDPGGDPNLARWWDGERWTEHTRLREDVGDQRSKTESVLTSMAAVFVIGAGILGGLVVSVFVRFGACRAWKGPAPDCSGAEQSAPFWLPVMSLLITVPIARAMTKKR